MMSTRIKLKMFKALAACAMVAPCARARAQDRELRLGVERPSCAKGADYSLIQPIASTPIFTSGDVSKWIPQNMAPTNDQSAVATQLVTRGFSNMLASPEFQRSRVGHAAHSVQERMKGNVAFGDGANGGVKHEFKFQMQPAGAKALLDYTGFLNAQLSYQALNQQAAFEIFENVSKQTRLVYDHTLATSDRRDTVGLKVEF